MAVGTNFSVTKKAGRPIANPPSPYDNPVVIGGENAVQVDAPSVLTAKPGTLTTPPFPRNYARILWDNLLVNSVVTSTISQSSAPLSLIPNTYQRWSFSSSSTESIEFELPNNVQMDTFCIGSDNLYESETNKTRWKFSYSSSTTGDYTALHSFTDPSSDGSGMVHIDNPVSVRRLLLEVEISPIRTKYIGYISAGIALQMQRPFFNGHTPITDSDVTEYFHNRSESGEIIGQSIRRQGYKTNAEWKNLDDEWYREYFAPFKQAAKLRPFFFAWNLLEYPQDVGFCRIAKDISAPMQNGFGTKRSLSMELLGAG